MKIGPSFNKISVAKACDTIGSEISFWSPAYEAIRKCHSSSPSRRLASCVPWVAGRSVSRCPPLRVLIRCEGLPCPTLISPDFRYVLDWQKASLAQEAERDLRHLSKV